MKNIIKNFAKKYHFLKRIYIFLKVKNKLIPKLEKQLLFKNPYFNNQNLINKKILIPIIETSDHYEVHHILGLAKALELRGAEIVVLVCDETLPGCELKSVKNENNNDPCWICRFNLKNVLGIYNFKIIKLNQYIDNKKFLEFKHIAEEFYNNEIEIISNGIKLNQAINDSIIRYFYGAVPKEKSKIKKVIIDHTITSLITSNAIDAITKKFKPDIVLNNMIAYSTWEPIYKYFIKNNIEFHTLNNTPYDFKKIDLNFFDIYKSKLRYKNYLKFRKNKILTKDELLKLEKFLGNRFSGNAEIFKNCNYFNNNNNNEKELLKKQLNLDENKRNIFLFSNLYWDAGMSDRGQLYEDVITWVIRTIEILKDNKNINLYIKTHPAEIYDSSESLSGVKQIVLEKIKKLPSNVSFIDPEYKIKPYDLFEFIDLGVLFDGTLGLEMLFKDVTVVDVGNTPYNGLGFAHEPKNEDEYKKILFGITPAKTPNRDNLNNFGYFYFICAHIPWTLTERYFANNFSGFNFNSLNDLAVGKDKYLDHICNCILNSAESKPDNMLS